MPETVLDTPMRPSNAPEIALAQEWSEQLDAYIAVHGLVGHDPFDIKQHPWFRAAQTSRLKRRTATVLADLAPNTARRWLKIPPSENPKAHALVAHGDLRMFQLTGEERHLERARGSLRWLIAQATPGQAGLCWGYPFDVFGRGVDTPAGTPVGVISAIAGQAFLHAHALTDEESFLDAAHSIAQFLLEGLPRIEAEDGTHCFGYTPTDHRRVHNANLLAVEHLLAVWRLTGEDALREAAEPALRFTLERQREDGAWTYGEHSEAEPYEAGLMAVIDHYHTGFVLRSLHGIHQAAEDKAAQRALQQGFKFYKTLYLPNGMPVSAHRKYPVDIHACAEAILCPVVISDSVFGTKKHATLALRWSHFHMRDHETGVPWHRKYPLHTARIVFPRWGVAWMYRALTEYLFRMYPRNAG